MNFSLLPLIFLHLYLFSTTWIHYNSVFFDDKYINSPPYTHKHTHQPFFSLPYFPFADYPWFDHPHAAKERNRLRWNPQSVGFILSSSTLLFFPFSGPQSYFRHHQDHSFLKFIISVRVCTLFSCASVPSLPQSLLAVPVPVRYVRGNLPSCIAKCLG